MNATSRLTILLSVVVFATANNLPKLSISVRDGSFAGVTSGLDPTISWSSKSFCDTVPVSVDFEYGIEAGISEDIVSMPKSLYGKCSFYPNGERMRGWGLTAKTKFSNGNFTAADVDVDVANEEIDAKFRFESKFNFDTDRKHASFSVDSVQADKTFPILEDSSITISPRYNFSSTVPDVIVKYDKGKQVGVEVAASKDYQSITLSGRLNEHNKISPMLTSTGDLTFEWEHSLGTSGDNSIKTTYKPNDSVDISWKDKGWSTLIHMDIDDHVLCGPDISFKKTITF